MLNIKGDPMQEKQGWRKFLKTTDRISYIVHRKSDVERNAMDEAVPLPVFPSFISSDPVLSLGFGVFSSYDLRCTTDDVREPEAGR